MLLELGHAVTRFPLPSCRGHGPQPTLVYSYTFKTIVGDVTTTISITCFNDEANTLTKDSNQVLAEIEHKDCYQLPPSLKALQGTTHIFQFRFDTGSTAKRPGFVLDKVFDLKGLPLPEPSVEPLKEVPNTDESSANKKLKQED
ncbi:DNA helicase [Tanacetum coccineum]